MEEKELIYEMEEFTDEEIELQKIKNKLEKQDVWRPAVDPHFDPAQCIKKLKVTEVN